MVPRDLLLALVRVPSVVLFASILSFVQRVWCLVVVLLRVSRNVFASSCDVFCEATGAQSLERGAMAVKGILLSFVLPIELSSVSCLVVD